MVEAIDESGRPLENCSLYRAPAYARSSSGSAFLLGKSGESGRIEFSSETRFTEDDRLHLTAPTYLPTVIPPAALLDGFERVELSRGAGQRFFCVDAFGEPLAGVAVFLSQRSFEHEAVAVPEGTDPPLPLGPVHEAVWAARSDESGQALVEGFPPGEYLLRAEHPTHALFDVSTGPVVDLPAGGPVELVFAELVGGAWKVEGDEVVSLRIATGGDLQFVGLVGREIRKVAMRLKARFPSSTVVVAARTSSEAYREPRMDLLLRNLGRRVVPLDFLPIDRIDGVQVIDVSTLLTTGTADPLPAGMDTCQILFVDGLSGEPELNSAFYVWPRLGFEEDSVHRIALHKGDNTLPVGSHRIRTRLPWLRGSFQPEELVVPGTNTIVIEPVVQPVTLRVRYPSGEECTTYALHVHTPDGTIDLQLQDLRQPQELWLPLGPTRLSATVFGYGTVQLDTFVEHDPSYSRRELLFQLK